MTFASQFRRGEGDERQIRSANGRLTVGVLTAAQALSMTGVSIVTLTTGLAGTYLAASPTLATAPLAAQFVATMCATFPAAMFMRKYGRRAGFTMGQIIGLLGALFSVYALMEQSFLLFLAAGAVLGVHNAFWGYYRFAAAEAADPAFKTRAISLVMAGGVLAGVGGPELAKHSRDVFEPVVFAGCYAAIAIMCAVNVLVLQFARARRSARCDAAHRSVVVRIAQRPQVLCCRCSRNDGLWRDDFGHGRHADLDGRLWLKLQRCGFCDSVAWLGHVRA